MVLGLPGWTSLSAPTGETVLTASGTDEVGSWDEYV